MVSLENTTKLQRKEIIKKKVFWTIPKNPEELFKGRLCNHNLSFRNEFYKNDMELSKELW